MDLERVFDYLNNIVRVQAKNNGLKADVVTAPDYRYTFRKDRQLAQNELTYDQIRMIGQLELAVRLLDSMQDVQDNLPYEAFLSEVRSTLNTMNDVDPEVSIATIMSSTSEIMSGLRQHQSRKVIRLSEVVAANALQIRNKTIGIKRESLSGGGRLEVV